MLTIGRKGWSAALAPGECFKQVGTGQESSPRLSLVWRCLDYDCTRKVSHKSRTRKRKRQAMFVANTAKNEHLKQQGNITANSHK